MEYFFLLGSVKGNEMLPRRAQLKAQVEATVAEVRNSPRLAANRTPKRLGTNNSEPRLGLRCGNLDFLFTLLPPSPGRT